MSESNDTEAACADAMKLFVPFNKGCEGPPLKQKPVDEYPDGFWHWLPKNSRVYREFERRALQMARTGRKRYSARTIIEILRWDSDIADSEKTFKINGNYVPGMARLFMATHGTAYPRFFELR